MRKRAIAFHIVLMKAEKQSETGFIWRRNY